MGVTLYDCPALSKSKQSLRSYGRVAVSVKLTILLQLKTLLRNY